MISHPGHPKVRGLDFLFALQTAYTVGLGGWCKVSTLHVIKVILNLSRQTFQTHSTGLPFGHLFQQNRSK